VENKFWYGSGYRKVGGKITDKIRYAATTVWRAVQEHAKKAKRWLRKFVIPTGKLKIAIDEKFLKCRKGIVVWLNAVLLFRVDKAWYGVIIHHDTLVVRDTNIKDKRKLRKLLRERQKQFTESFARRLRRRLGNRKIELIVTDFDTIYPGIVDEYFPKAKHQICILHIEKSVYRAFEKEFGRELDDDIKGIREKLLDVFDADTVEQAMSILDSIPMDRFKQGGSVSRVINKIRNWRDRIFQFLQTGIKTNNTIEHVFARVDPLFEVMKSFQSESSMKNFLSGLVVWNNTCPFVDSKFRGMSPVDLLQIGTV